MISAFVNRKPWATVTLALIIDPLIGMLFLGQGRKALFYVAVGIVLQAFPYVAAHYQVVDMEIDLMAGLGTLTIKTLGAIHCYSVSKKTQGQVPEVWFARWYWMISMVFIAPVFFAILIRTFLWEPFNIPSQSNLPTLKVGDHLFASKFTYGYSRYSLPLDMPLISRRILYNSPERGDMFVFKSPADGSTDFIKRLVGLPGDTVQIAGGILHINGKAIVRRRIEDYIDTDYRGNSRHTPRFNETLPNGVQYEILEAEGDTAHFDNTEMFTVPEDHFFAIGDNRDNSSDSRSFGFIPTKNLIGKMSSVYWNSVRKKIHFFE